MRRTRKPSSIMNRFGRIERHVLRVRDARGGRGDVLARICGGAGAGDGGDDPGPGGDPADAVIAGIGDVDVVCGVDGDAAGGVQQRRRCETAVTRESGGREAGDPANVVVTEDLADAVMCGVRGVDRPRAVYGKLRAAVAVAARRIARHLHLRQCFELSGDRAEVVERASRDRVEIARGAQETLVAWFQGYEFQPAAGNRESRPVEGLSSPSVCVW